MNGSREQFLERVQHAVRIGNRAGPAPPVPERGNAGYQGGDPDPAARFCDQCAAAGAQVHRVANADVAAARVLEWVQSKTACRVLLGRERILDELGLAERLSGIAIEIWRPGDPPHGDREDLFAADVGITGVDYLIAETGSVVAAASRDHPRSLSLLPPVHIAVARSNQILPDLFDLLHPQRLGSLPSCLAVITGPSKTGDIELKLVTGVHGPGEVHVVLIE